MILGATVAGKINLIEVFKNVTQPLHLDIHYTMRKDWLKKGLLLTHSITTKGRLISERNCGALNFSKNATKYF